MAALDADGFDDVDVLMPAAAGGLDADGYTVTVLMPGNEEISSAGAPDVTAPTITVISPPAGSPITATTPLVVDVEDETSLANVALYAEFPTTIPAELIHNGTSFLAPYAAGSTRTAIPNGFRFSLLRAGGWPGDVSLSPIVVDGGGNVLGPA